MNTSFDNVILVNELDEPIGLMEKQLAHEKGSLHRAVSVFIFNTKGEMLLQRRASSKYHSAGLWTNAACSHPRINETSLDAAIRRLEEEMGIVCNLNYEFSFTYKALLSNNLIEHEFDYVFTGISDSVPIINKDEVDEFRYISVDALKVELASYPNLFTEWFKIVIQNILTNYQTNQ
jgi:isopentenyl-diphosphate delta-isomerase